MQDPPAFIVPTSVILAIASVAMAGFGGLMEDDQLRLLFGGGVIFCLSMIVVLLVFVRELSYETEGGIYAVLGALAGLCMGLFYWQGPVASLIIHIVVGAAIGFCSYWVRVLRSSSFWRD